jgi:hypothetical protein
LGCGLSALRGESRGFTLCPDPGNLCGNRRRADFDPTVIGFDNGSRRGGRDGRIVEELDNVVMRCTVVAFQRQGVVAAPIHDLLRDGAMAVERVGGHDGAFQGQHHQHIPINQLDS